MKVKWLVTIALYLVCQIGLAEPDTVSEQAIVIADNQLDASTSRLRRSRPGGKKRPTRETVEQSTGNSQSKPLQATVLEKNIRKKSQKHYRASKPVVRRQRPGNKARRSASRVKETQVSEANRPVSGDSLSRQRPGKVLRAQTLPEQRDPNQAGGLARIFPPPRRRILDDSFLPVQDRWRLGLAIGQPESLMDPYHRNVLKADRPIFGDDVFLSFSVISDSVGEYRQLPTPVGPQASRRAGSLDVQGRRHQGLFSQTLFMPISIYKGDTVFRPPDVEFRITPAITYNYADVQEKRALVIDPGNSSNRHDKHFALQELFLDVHLRNVSDRYDFDSLRVGIQPITNDFRGFLFIDNQLGVRLFGTRDNNLWQYNLAWFRRIEKDTNSGLNDIRKELRDDHVFLANLYRQDFPVRGFTSQISAVYNRNREGNDKRLFDKNGFLARPASLGTERPRSYDAYYVGYNGDGHIGRTNLTVSAYYLFGRESRGTFTNEDTDIRAFFTAGEVSWDFDWVRLRISGLWASGDKNPFDKRAEGFDAIVENPLIAGADTNFWIRQSIPLIGGGGVALSGRNGVLNSLRSSKDQGQSNFANPGIILGGIGADFDILPELRVSTNVNHMFFDETAVLKVARNQGSISRDIGWDLSVSSIYRPFQSQNIVFRLSGAMLIPGEGIRELYDDKILYSVLGNLILTY
ncbi:MAG TPA: hypothetical protein ENJ32_10190 [Crenotrichaceae bacterium]|nr:hypothetical protein [Crenotrichaceae bacterium]